MNPLIALSIKNHKPELIYYPKEGEKKKLTLKDENIYEIVIQIAREIGLINKEAIAIDVTILSDLLDIAREADELFITDLPEIETESLEFDLEIILNNFLHNILKNDVDEYKDIEMPDLVRVELELNKKKDIFASILDVMYSILIAKSLLAAAELGLGIIKLEDEGKNPRLAEKMSKELTKLEVEMIIE